MGGEGKKGRYKKSIKNRFGSNKENALGPPFEGEGGRGREGAQSVLFI